MVRKVTDPGAKQVAEDVRLALQLRGQMHEISVRQILKLACWLTSNRAGKRNSCQNWSVGAMERRRSWPAGTDWPADHGLIHEHIVPRKWIENSLYKLPLDPKIDEIKALLDLSEVCVVTECEDRKFGSNKLKQGIPKGCTLPRDKWLRYELAGVKRYLATNDGSQSAHDEAVRG